MADLKQAIATLALLTACADAPQPRPIPASAPSLLAVAEEPVPAILWVSPEFGERACDAVCETALAKYRHARIREPDGCGVVLVPGDGGIERVGCRVVVSAPDDVDLCELAGDVAVEAR